MVLGTRKSSHGSEKVKVKKSIELNKKEKVAFGREVAEFYDSYEGKHWVKAYLQWRFEGAPYDENWKMRIHINIIPPESIKPTSRGMKQTTGEVARCLPIQIQSCGPQHAFIVS